ncbi:Zn-ribbon domain-containing OB-fold protein [Cupriavidus pauculus]|uniref:Zn-ribbon domain-containing OB-fold protein n=2 Tax=Cupriavidus pauculus TaxID=82633 RepID=A0A5P2HGD6_9BURK|nr:Zn-ribbon domain-containing OB-fold protein [Cupriavidus pauculus]
MIMTDYNKPLPVLGDDNRPFWEAARREELRMQQCLDCGHIRYPINHVCPQCLSERADWRRLSGRGTVFSYIVFHQVYHAGFAQDVPYNVAMIQLEEGPRMISNVVGVPNDAVKVGDAVTVTFDKVTEEITIPRFTPAGKPA